MIDPLIPDEEQERDIDRIRVEESGAALDASTPGAGKTLVALEVAKRRGADTVLVSAPLGTRLGWETAAKRIGYDLPFNWIRNHKTGHESLVRLQFGEPGIYFIGPQYATTIAWDDTGLKNSKGQRIKKKNKLWDSIHADFMAFDEIHQGNITTSSQRFKVYSQMHADFILGMSGTPAGNSWEGIYGVSKLLWPDVAPKKLTDFKRQWCETEYDHFAFDHMKVIGEREPGAYFRYLPCVVRREWEFEHEIDDQIVYVELSAAERKAYRELEQNMVTMLENDPFIIEFPQTLRIRLRQVTLGLPIILNDGSVDFAMDCRSTKLNKLKDVLAKDFDGEPALILTDSKRFAKVAVERIKSWGFTAAEYSGSVGTLKRDEIREAFRGGGIHYLVLVIKTNTGLDGLQEATRNIAILSDDDSRIEGEQAFHRIVRRGQNQNVRVRRLYAADTYDLKILSKQTLDRLAMNRSISLTNVRR